jgi:hypothetical protein
MRSFIPATGRTQHVAGVCLNRIGKVASCALAGAFYVPARGAGLNIETATIADLNAAFADGTLTSEQLVSAYLKRIEAYDKQAKTASRSTTKSTTTKPPNRLSERAADQKQELQH